MCRSTRALPQRLFYETSHVWSVSTVYLGFNLLKTTSKQKQKFPNTPLPPVLSLQSLSMALLNTLLLLAFIVGVVHCESFSCTVGTPTTISESDDVTISGDHSCGTIIIKGNLSIQSTTHLTADRIEVASTGALLVGTRTDPVRDVTIHLNHKMATDVTPDEKGNRPNPPEGQLMSYGITKMHGVPKTSWTLLNKDCVKCTTLSVEECSGWVPGDRLVVAPTGNGATSNSALINDPDSFKSEERTISAVSESSNGCTITLDSALSYHYRGEWLDEVVPTQSEVLNLNRSILITGPDVHWYDEADPIKGFQGITTRQQGTAGHMHIEYVRVEKCGRVHLAEYCLHFHYAGDCPTCIFRGNVVTQSNNKGLTVHGTHHSLVDRNVVYDHRGAFLYIEDGNEYENTIRYLE